MHDVEVHDAELLELYQLTREVATPAIGEEARRRLVDRMIVHPALQTRLKRASMKLVGGGVRRVDLWEDVLQGATVLLITRFRRNAVHFTDEGAERFSRWLGRVCRNACLTARQRIENRCVGGSAPSYPGEFGVRLSRLQLARLWRRVGPEDSAETAYNVPLTGLNLNYIPCRSPSDHEAIGAKLTQVVNAILAMHNEVQRRILIDLINGVALQNTANASGLSRVQVVKLRQRGLGQLRDQCRPIELAAAEDGQVQRIRRIRFRSAKL
ncbi:MAG: hypothetical protein ACKV0T_22340 [Planctomycetales bacterium]